MAPAHGLRPYEPWSWAIGGWLLLLGERAPPQPAGILREAGASESSEGHERYLQRASSESCSVDGRLLQKLQDLILQCHHAQDALRCPSPARSVVCDHLSDAAGQALRRGDVEELIGAVGIGAGAEDARDQELCLGKTLAEHGHERD